MSARKIPLVTEQTYHILNRGVNAVPIFEEKRDYNRFLLAAKYYQNQSTPFQFSRLLKMSKERKVAVCKKMAFAKNFLVDVVAYCLMPNHFHLILRQSKDNGITNFVRLLTDSYVRYFNIKYQRKGPLFVGRFRAVRVSTEEQLLHLSRYVHLNPFSDFVVKKMKDLSSYQYSSLSEYLSGEQKWCNKGIVLSQFGPRNRRAVNYQKFIFDQAGHQRVLAIIKHQLLENV